MIGPDRFGQIFLQSFLEVLPASADLHKSFVEWCGISSKRRILAGKNPFSTVDNALHEGL
jgi:hypothetical protein